MPKVPFDVAEMKKNFALPWPDGLIKSEPHGSPESSSSSSSSSGGGSSNSLDFETGQDFSWRIPEAGPIKSSELLSMNDTLEHLRALCLQQAASDVQRACRQLRISSSTFNFISR